MPDFIPPAARYPKIESTLATIAPQAGALKIVHVNRTAQEMHIRPGQTLAEAKAIVPHLVTREDDPRADRRALESLAVRADCLSPTVHVEGPDTLILDVTGSERLFGGEVNLVRRAVRGFEEQGFTVRAALADTPGAAWALAHAHPEPEVIAEPGRSAECLAPLPVWSLRIEPRVSDALSALGVETISSLLYLPRSSLASRFGQSLLDRIDYALGNLPEPLTAYRPRPALSRRFHLGAATTRIDVLAEAVRRALVEFCGQLEKRLASVRQMFVTFSCPDVATEEGSQRRTVTLPVSLSQPSRSMKHLYALIVVLLDRLDLPGPADALMLWASQLDPLEPRQEELFAMDQADLRELDHLVDRLAVRLGAGAVVRPELVDDHQPERAFRYVSAVGSGCPFKRRAVGFNSRGASNAIDASPASESSRGLDPEPQALACANTPDFGAPQRSERSRGLKPAARGAERSRGLKPAARGMERSNSASGLRPLRLLPRPVEIAVTAVVPEGPPIVFELHGTRYAVADCIGPERLETGWWRGPHVRRDYYRVATENGRRCWFFRQRETGKWFLHGWFD